MLNSSILNSDKREFCIPLRLVIISHSKSFIKKITKINNVQQKKQGRNKKSRPQTCLEGGA